MAFAAALIFAIVSVDRGVLPGLLWLRTYNGNVIAEAALRPESTAATTECRDSACLEQFDGQDRPKPIMSRGAADERK